MEHSRSCVLIDVQMTLIDSPSFCFSCKNLRQQYFFKNISLALDFLLPTQSTRRVRKKGPGFLFIMREGGSGDLFKIGVTTNLHDHLLALQSGNPRQLQGELLFRVTDIEKADEFVQKSLRKLSLNLNGGSGWYKVATAGDREFFYDVMDDIRGKFSQSEIAKEKFLDYVQFYVVADF